MEDQQLENKYDKLKTNYKENVEMFKDIFSYPLNHDFKVREVIVSALNKKASIFYLTGIVDECIIDDHIVHPLLEDQMSNNKIVMENIITTKILKRETDVQKIINHIIKGYTALITESDPTVYLIYTVKFEHRDVDQPVNENTIVGPKESFVESAHINISLIRKRLRSEKLIDEIIQSGERSKCDINVLYMKNLVDPNLVQEVKTRINKINVENISSLETLEQYLEESAYSLIPSMLNTERPDRATAFLMEGHVVLLMDSSSSCLILPVTFWSLFHTSEETYQRLPYGNFIRVIRFIALFFALFTPAIYIAVTQYHTEMIPTDLLLAIAATRERVPFPAVIEVIIMEISFEILREAGIRIPTPVGPTVGIVGALILGEAAVQANIISPILIIVVAITGLSSYAIPNNSLSYMIRIARFFFLLFAVILGGLGLAIAVAIALSYSLSKKSFGVPFFAPYVPRYSPMEDIGLRKPLWKQIHFPKHVNPQDDIRRQNTRQDES